MKKAVWIAAAVVLVLITVFCVLYFTQEDYTFYCGLEEFGGPEEVTHPTLCDIEEAKLDKYFPLCIELVEGTEHSY
ncbi:hypothetical protein JXC34_01090, partial [Candidatus Woesearchaeota archaeon]|nr:hypothetical protein [Candidatus Woesearchaeota archaeon]